MRGVPKVAMASADALSIEASHQDQAFRTQHWGPDEEIDKRAGEPFLSDQKMLVADSRLNAALYAYSLPDLKLLGNAALGGRGAEWLTISPDDKTVYVANAHTNDISVVDIASMKEIARIPGATC